MLFLQDNIKLNIMKKQLCIIAISSFIGFNIKAQIISTVAGNNTVGYNSDGIPAINAELHNPSSVVMDGAGNLYIADSGNNRIRKVNGSGTISTYAGNGTAGFSG